VNLQAIVIDHTALSVTDTFPTRANVLI